MIEVVTYGGYPFDVFVCVGESAEAVVAHIEGSGVSVSRKERREITEEEYDEAWTYMLAGGEAILFFDTTEDAADAGLMAHEIFHAVWALMDRIGVSPSEDSEEAYAYAIQDLTSKILPLVK